MIWWIDTRAGASGDMLLGALLGLDPQQLPLARQAINQVLDSLGAEPVTLSLDEVSRAGLRANKAVVQCADSATRRTWAQIASAVEGTAAQVFETLARAEAHVHGIPVEDVHFHEVGALDAIADIVGVCALVEALKPQRIVVSPVCVGSGTVATEHGVLSVPGPAVTQLLQGVPTFGGSVVHEACTPTAAALLRVIADDWGPQPAMSVAQTSSGAGQRDPHEQPNLLRILAGHSRSASSMQQIETTIDDLDPRLYPDVLAAVKSAGAVEAWLTPVIMKHGRPAVTLTALAVDADAVARALFRHTTTLGVRFHPIDRQTLDRDVVTRSVDGQPVRVKRGWLDGEVITEQPEYVDARAAARELGLPVREVLAKLAAKQKGSDATDGGDSDVRTPRN